MTSAWNGRIYNAIKEHGEDFAILWDGQIWDFEGWVIPKGTNNLKEALDFIPVLPVVTGPLSTMCLGLCYLVL